MSYNHRPLGASGNTPGPGSIPANARLSDLLDFVRQEFDLVQGEAQSMKHQNVEYENHAHGQIKEVAALRHSFIELEREHQKLKEQYEEEIRKLKRELEARATTGPVEAPVLSRPMPVLPTPQGLSGGSSIFGTLPPSQQPEHPTNAPPQNSQPQSAAPPGAAPAQEHSNKRKWNDEHTAQPHYPRPLDAGPRPNFAPHAPLHAQPPPSATARLPQPPPARPADAPPETPKEVKRENADWTTMYNPKVKRTLDVELVHTLVHDSVVCCVKFSPNGKLLATGCNRSTILYDTATGQKHCVLSDPSTAPRDDNYIRSACFSSDGKLIATGSEDRKIRIWDVASRRISHVLEGHMNEIYSLAFSPDDRLLYSGSGDQTSKVWDVETGVLKMTLAGDEPVLAASGQPVDAGVTSIAVSASGRILAAGSLDTVVRLWDTTTGKVIDRLRGHKDSVYSVAFAPDGSWLVTGSLDKTLKIWDLGPVNALLATQAPDAAAQAQAQEPPRSVKAEAAEGDNKPQTQQARGPEETKTPCLSTMSGHKDYVLSVAVSPDGQWIVSGSKDRGVSFWDPKATSATVVLQGHKNSVISIAVSDQGGLLATGSGDWSCRVWKYGPTPAAPLPAAA